jgi:ribonucleotide monophosphatase NagD (HAD superfamily)
MSCPAHEAVMVGDDAEFDIAPAVRAGLFGILVKTGKYFPGAENRFHPMPTAVVDDIAVAARWIRSQRP